MIEVNVTNEQLERAKDHFAFGALNNSITEGEANIVGAIGEIVVFDYFSQTCSVDFTSTFDFDMIVNGFKIDVKTRKSTAKPTSNFSIDIPAFNIEQKCDFFFFVYVLKTLKKAFLVGYIRPKDFFEIADFFVKGELNVRQWAYRCDTYTVKVKDLKQFKQR
jgi:hypothetical protein